METVVVTASAGSFPGLLAALRTLTVKVEEYPLIDFKAPADSTHLDSALDKIGSYEAVVFTSPRAARIVSERMRHRGISPDTGGNPPGLWAGGTATAAALGGLAESVRIPLERDSSVGAASALAQAILDDGTRGPVLFLCGRNHREELPARLRREGVQVDEVVCYDSILASEPVARNVMGRASVLIVASPSVADLLVRSCPRELRPDLIAVGPTTAASAAAAGWPPAAVATHPTTEAVTAAARSVLARRSR